MAKTSFVNQKPDSPDKSWDKVRNRCGIHKTRWDATSIAGSGVYSGGPGPGQDSPDYGQICYEVYPKSTRSPDIVNQSSIAYTKFDPIDEGFNDTIEAATVDKNQGTQFNTSYTGGDFGGPPALTRKPIPDDSKDFLTPAQPGPAVRRNENHKPIVASPDIIVPGTGKRMTKDHVEKIRLLIESEMVRWDINTLIVDLKLPLKTIKKGETTLAKEFDKYRRILNKILQRAAGDDLYNATTNPSGLSNLNIGNYWNFNLSEIRGAAALGALPGGVGLADEATKSDKMLMDNKDNLPSLLTNSPAAISTPTTKAAIVAKAIDTKNYFQHADNKVLDWRNLVQRLNTIKNSCVCHRDCSCNWVCGAYQTCRCNSYYSSTLCDINTEDVRNLTNRIDSGQDGMGGATSDDPEA